MEQDDSPPPEYAYKGVPLTPTVASMHILDYLRAHPSPVLRRELAKYAADQHLNRGGRVEGDPIASVKKALSRLEDERKVARPAPGYYSLSKDGARPESDADAVPLLEPVDQLAKTLLVVEETIGAGDEFVYAYYQRAEKELAVRDGKDCFPCKIGSTTGNLTTRILEQCRGAGVARLPIVGLVIRTDDGSRLERTIHFALDQADARIDDAVGTEWFNTSPDKVKAWCLAYMQLVGQLRCRTSPTSEEANELPDG